MSHQATLLGLLVTIRRGHAARDARRALERELAAYESDADRNDLQLIAQSRHTSAAWEIDEILTHQAHVRLHRAN